MASSLASASKTTSQTAPAWPLRLAQSTDLLLALAVVAGAAAARSLPGGSTLRLVLTLPVILFVPGYLLLQALLVPVRPGAGHLLQTLLAVGISLPLVGLFALSTSLVAGGFRPTPIVLAISLGCLTLAAVALVRRLLLRAPAEAAGGLA